MAKLMVAPSILSVINNNLENNLKLLEETDCEYIHLDVMDGIFVNNKTFDEELIKTIKTNKIKDTHLMIINPLQVIDKYLEVSDIVTIHYEALSSDELLNYLKNKKESQKIGLAIKPNTNPTVLDIFLPYLDLVLVMSVEPGFGGQKFMTNAIEKICYFKEQKIKHNYRYLIEVDGGINNETADVVQKAGCEIVVAGSYVFKSDNYQQQIDALRHNN